MLFFADGKNAHIACYCLRLMLIISMLSYSRNNQVEAIQLRNPIKTTLFDPYRIKLSNFTLDLIEDFRMQAANLRSNIYEFFQKTYNKTYTKQHELLKRSKLFLNRLNHIEEWNVNYNLGLKSYRLRENHFTDWTNKELKKFMSSKSSQDSLMSGSLRNRANYNYNYNNNKQKRISVPKTIDWSKSKCLAPVRDQAKCESCYAFAAIDLLATMHCLASMKSNATKSVGSTLRSVQQIIDCASSKREFARTIRGCNGGQSVKVLDYLRKYKPNLMTEHDYPYKARREQCKMYSFATNHHPKMTRSISNGSASTTINYNKFPYVRLNSESQIMQHLANYGPVISSLRVIDNFVSYGGGLYEDDFSGNCQRSTYNHIILIVGYGTDLQTKRRFWLAKNSWGIDWGERGFFRIIRGNCRIANWAIGIKI